MRRTKVIGLIVALTSLTFPATSHAAPKNDRAGAARHSSLADRHVKILDEKGLRETLGFRALGYDDGPLTLRHLREMQLAGLSAARPRGGSRYIQLWPRQTSANDDPQKVDDSFRLPITDINGDGKDDVLVIEYEDSYAPGVVGMTSLKIKLQARRGLDGTVLWTTSAFEIDGDGSLGIWAGALFSDGRTGILVYQDNYPYDVGCSIRARTIDLRASLELLSASDATMRWVRRYDGSLRYRNVCLPLSPSSTTVERVEGMVTSVEPGYDGSGTGHGDVYVETDDFTYRNVEDEISRLKVTSTEHLLDDRTGYEVTSMKVSSVGSAPVIDSVPDLSGDHLGDLTVVVGDTWSARSVDGRRTFWTSPFQTDTPYFIVYPRSVTAADSYELEVYTITIDRFDCGTSCIGFIIIFGRGRYMYTARSGTLLWGREARGDDRTPYGFFDDAGTIDADGGVDFYEIGFNLNFDHVTVQTTSGATGEPLSALRVLDATGPDGTTSSVLLDGLGDLNGDGAADLALGNYSVTGAEFDRTFARADEHAVSGKDGSTIWDLGTVTDRSQLLTRLGDLDLDGRSDLWRPEGSGDAIMLRFLDGVTLQPLGSIDGLSGGFLWPELTDAAGSPAPEIFEQTWLEVQPQSYTATLYMYDLTGPLWTAQVVPDFSS